jgi:uncharacterized membrane protein
MGVLWIILSSLFQVSKDTVSKKVSFTVPGVTSAFASFLFPLPFYVILLPLLYFFHLDTLSFSIALLVAVFLRAITDTGFETSKMIAFQYNDLSTVAVLNSFAGVLSALLSPLITGDQFDLHSLIGVALSTIGTLIIVYKPLRLSSGKGLISALACPIFGGLNRCFDRLSSQAGSPPLAAFLMTILSCLFLWPAVRKSSNAKKDLKENFQTFTWRGFFEVGFMTTKLLAYQILTPAEASAIAPLSLVFSVIVGKKLFQEEGFLRRIVGLTFILAGAIFVSLYKLQLI